MATLREKFIEIYWRYNSDMRRTGSNPETDPEPAYESLLEELREYQALARQAIEGSKKSGKSA